MDYSNMSDDELLAIANGSGKKDVDYSNMSDDELLALANGSPSEDAKPKEPEQQEQKPTDDKTEDMRPTKEMEAADRLAVKNGMIPENPTPNAVDGWENGDGGDARLPEGETNEWGGNLRNEGRKPLFRRDEKGKINGYSTTSSTVVKDDDGKFAVVPTVVDGEDVGEMGAYSRYKETGEHWGKSDTEEGAKSIADEVHNRHMKDNQASWNKYIHDNWDEMSEDITGNEEMQRLHEKKLASRKQREFANSNLGKAYHDMALPHSKEEIAQAEDDAESPISMYFKAGHANLSRGFYAMAKPWESVASGALKTLGGVAQGISSVTKSEDGMALGNFLVNGGKKLDELLEIATYDKDKYGDEGGMISAAAEKYNSILHTVLGWRTLGKMMGHTGATATMATTMGANSYYSLYDSAKASKMSDEEARKVATTGMATDMAFTAMLGMMPFSKILGLGKNAPVINMLKSGAPKNFQDLTREVLKGYSKNYALQVGAASLESGAIMGAQAAADTAIGEVAQGKDIDAKEAAKEGLLAFAEGTALGGVMGATEYRNFRKNIVQATKANAISQSMNADGRATMAQMFPDGVKEMMRKRNAGEKITPKDLHDAGLPTVPSENADFIADLFLQDAKSAMSGMGDIEAARERGKAADAYANRGGEATVNDAGAAPYDIQEVKPIDYGTSQMEKGIRETGNEPVNFTIPVDEDGNVKFTKMEMDNLNSGGTEPVDVAYDPNTGVGIVNRDGALVVQSPDGVTVPVGNVEDGVKMANYLALSAQLEKARFDQKTAMVNAIQENMPNRTIVTVDDMDDIADMIRASEEAGQSFGGMTVQDLDNVDKNAAAVAMPDGTIVVMFDNIGSPEDLTKSVEAAAKSIKVWNGEDGQVIQMNDKSGTVRFFMPSGEEAPVIERPAFEEKLNGMAPEDIDSWNSLIESDSPESKKGFVELARKYGLDDNEIAEAWNFYTNTDIGFVEPRPEPKPVEADTSVSTSAEEQKPVENPAPTEAKKPVDDEMYDIVKSVQGAIDEIARRETEAAMKDAESKAKSQRKGELEGAFKDAEKRHEEASTEAKATDEGKVAPVAEKGENEAPKARSTIDDTVKAISAKTGKSVEDVKGAIAKAADKVLNNEHDFVVENGVSFDKAQAKAFLNFLKDAGGIGAEAADIAPIVGEIARINPAAIENFARAQEASGNEKSAKSFRRFGYKAPSADGVPDRIREDYNGVLKSIRRYKVENGERKIRSLSDALNADDAAAELSRIIMSPTLNEMRDAIRPYAPQLSATQDFLEKEWRKTHPNGVEDASTTKEIQWDKMNSLIVLNNELTKRRISDDAERQAAIDEAFRRNKSLQKDIIGKLVNKIEDAKRNDLPELQEEYEHLLDTSKGASVDLKPVEKALREKREMYAADDVGTSIEDWTNDKGKNGGRSSTGTFSSLGPGIFQIVIRPGTVKRFNGKAPLATKSIDDEALPYIKGFDFRWTRDLKHVFIRGLGGGKKNNRDIELIRYLFGGDFAEYPFPAFEKGGSGAKGNIANLGEMIATKIGESGFKDEDLASEYADENQGKIYSDYLKDLYMYLDWKDAKIAERKASRSGKSKEAKNEVLDSLSDEIKNLETELQKMQESGGVDYDRDYEDYLNAEIGRLTLIRDERDAYDWNTRQEILAADEASLEEMANAEQKPDEPELPGGYSKEYMDLLADAEKEFEKIKYDSDTQYVTMSDGSAMRLMDILPNGQLVIEDEGGNRYTIGKARNEGQKETTAVNKADGDEDVRGEELSGSDEPAKPEEASKPVRGQPAAVGEAGRAEGSGSRGLSKSEKAKLHDQWKQLASIAEGKSDKIPEGMTFPASVIDVKDLASSDDAVSWPVTGLTAKTSEDRAKLFQILYRPDCERAKVLYLDANDKVVGSKVFALGGVSGSKAPVGDIVGGMPKGCAKVVVSHNHPSGDVRPSAKDKAWTDELSAEVKAVDANVSVDHIVTDTDRFYSFGEGKTTKAEIVPDNGRNIVPYGDRIPGLAMKGGAITVSDQTKRLATHLSTHNPQLTHLVGINSGGVVSGIVQLTCPDTVAGYKALLAQMPDSRTFAIGTGTSPFNRKALLEAIESVAPPEDGKQNAYIVHLNERGMEGFDADIGKDSQEDIRNRFLNPVKTPQMRAYEKWLAGRKNANGEPLADSESSRKMYSALVNEGKVDPMTGVAPKAETPMAKRTAFFNRLADAKDVSFTMKDGEIYIHGNTYALKNELKANGFRAKFEDRKFVAWTIGQAMVPTDSRILDVVNDAKGATDKALAAETAKREEAKAAKEAAKAEAMESGETDEARRLQGRIEERKADIGERKNALAALKAKRSNLAETQKVPEKTIADKANVDQNVKDIASHEGGKHAVDAMKAIDAGDFDSAAKSRDGLEKWAKKAVSDKSELPSNDAIADLIAKSGREGSLFPREMGEIMMRTVNAVRRARGVMFHPDYQYGIGNTAPIWDMISGDKRADSLHEDVSVPESKEDVDRQIYEVCSDLATQFFDQGIGSSFDDFVKFADENIGEDMRHLYPSLYLQATMDIDTARIGGKKPTSFDDVMAKGRELLGLPSKPKDKLGARVPDDIGEFVNPKPTARVGKSEFNGGLDADQLKGVNLALDRLEKPGGNFLFADNTGVGKTRQLLATAQRYMEMHPGARVAFFMPSKDIYDGSYSDDARALGINLNNFKFATYTALAGGGRTRRMFFDGSPIVSGYDLAIFDEAHNLSNSETKRFMQAKALMPAHKVFATATPLDKLGDSEYFLSQISNVDPNAVAAALGYRRTEFANGIVRRERAGKNVSLKSAQQNIVRLRNIAMMAGSMVRRSFRYIGEIHQGYVRSSGHVLRNEAALREVLQFNLMNAVRNSKVAYHHVRDEFGNFRKKAFYSHELTKDAFIEHKNEELHEIRNSFFQAIDKLAENDKAQHAGELVSQVLSRKPNAQIIICATQVNEQWVNPRLTGGKRTQPAELKGLELVAHKKDGYAEPVMEYRMNSAIDEIVDDLKRWGYGDDVGVLTGNTKTKGKSTSTIGSFQKGTKKILVMTDKSGGTGINLHDTEGDKPRVMIVFTRNYSAKEIAQLIGRIFRRNSASPGEVIFVSGDSYADAHRMNVSQNKMSTLEAIVGSADSDAFTDAVERFEESAPLRMEKLNNTFYDALPADKQFALDLVAQNGGDINKAAEIAVQMGEDKIAEIIRNPSNKFNVGKSATAEQGMFDLAEEQRLFDFMSDTPEEIDYGPIDEGIPEDLVDDYATRYNSAAESVNASKAKIARMEKTLKSGKQAMAKSADSSQLIDTEREIRERVAKRGKEVMKLRREIKSIQDRSNAKSRSMEAALNEKRDNVARVESALKVMRMSEPERAAEVKRIESEMAAIRKEIADIGDGGAAEGLAKIDGIKSSIYDLRRSEVEDGADHSAEIDSLRAKMSVLEEENLRRAMEANFAIEEKNGELSALGERVSGIKQVSKMRPDRLVHRAKAAERYIEDGRAKIAEGMKTSSVPAQIAAIEAKISDLQRAIRHDLSFSMMTDKQVAKGLTTEEYNKALQEGDRIAKAIAEERKNLAHLEAVREEIKNSAPALHLEFLKRSRLKAKDGAMFASSGARDRDGNVIVDSEVSRMGDNEVALMYASSLDERAMAELYRRHSNGVLNILRANVPNGGDPRFSPEDGASEVWYKVEQALTSGMFDPEKGNFGKWIHAIAFNTAYTYAGKGNVFRMRYGTWDAMTSGTDFAEDAPETDVFKKPSADRYRQQMMDDLSLAAEKERNARIREAVSKMPPRIRRIYTAYLNNRTARDAAKELGMSEQEVGQVIHEHGAGVMAYLRGDSNAEWQLNPKAFALDTTPANIPDTGVLINDLGLSQEMALIAREYRFGDFPSDNMADISAEIAKTVEDVLGLQNSPMQIEAAIEHLKETLGDKGIYLERSSLERLSDLERSVYDMIQADPEISHKQIAAKLGRSSEKAIGSIVSNIYKKLSPDADSKTTDEVVADAKRQPKTGPHEFAGLEGVKTKYRTEFGGQMSLFEDQKVPIQTEMDSLLNKRDALEIGRFDNAAMDRMCEYAGIPHVTHGETRGIESLERTLRNDFTNKQWLEGMKKYVIGLPKDQPVSERIQTDFGAAMVEVFRQYDDLSRTAQLELDSGNNALASLSMTEAEKLLPAMYVMMQANAKIGSAAGRSLAARRNFVTNENLLYYTVLRVQRRLGGPDKVINPELMDAIKRIVSKISDAEQAELAAREDVLRFNMESMLNTLANKNANMVSTMKFNPRTERSIIRNYEEAMRQIEWHVKEKGPLIQGLPEGKKWLRALQCEHLRRGEGYGADGKADPIALTELIGEDLRGLGVIASGYQIDQMMTGMGTQILSPKDKVSVDASDANRQRLVLHQMDYMLEFGKVAPRTGPEYVPPTQAQRELVKQRRQLINELGLDKRSEDDKLKTSLMTAITRRKNRIEDIKKAIAERRRLAKKTGRNHYDDPVYKALGEELELLEKTLNEVAPLTEAEQHEEAVMKILGLLNREAEYWNRRIESDKAGDFDAPDKKPRVQDSRIDGPQKKVDDLKAEHLMLKNAAFPEGTPKEVERRVQSNLKAYTNHQIDLERQIIAFKTASTYEERKAAFTAPARNAMNDPRLLDKKAEVARLVAEKERLIASVKREGRELGELVDYAEVMFSTFPRAIRAGFDLSACLRQAGLANFIDPKLASKAFVSMIKAVPNNGAYERMRAELENDFYYKDFVASKGRIYGEAITGNQPDEFYGTDLRLKVPFSKKTWAVSDIPGVKMSERTFATYLNTMNVGLYRALIEGGNWPAGGPTKEQRFEMARVISAFTGSEKSIGPGEGRYQSWLMFAPRYMAATFKTAFGYPAWRPFLPLGWIKDGSSKDIYTYEQQAEVAKRAGKMWLKGAAGIVAFQVLANMLFGDDELGEKWEDFWSPSATDFLTVKGGNMHFNLGKPWTQWWTFLFKAIGNTASYLGGERDVKFGDTIKRLLEGKLSPSAGVVYNTLDREDYLNNKIDWTYFGPEDKDNKRISGARNLIESLLIPMVVSDTYNLMKNEKWTKWMWAAPLMLFGSPIQVYNDDMRRYVETPVKRLQEYRKLDRFGDEGDADAFFKKHRLMITLGEELESDLSEMRRAKGLAGKSRRIGDDDGAADNEEWMNEARQRVLARSAELRADNAKKLKEILGEQ